MSPIAVGSVGDIIALSTLAYEVIKILARGSSTSAETRALAQEVTALYAALGFAQTVLTSEAHVDIPLTIRDAVAQTFATCQTILNRLRDHILSYRREEQGASASAKTWKVVWTACSWTVLGKNEAEGLRVRLNKQIITIQTLLSAIQSHSLAVVESRTRDDSSTIARIAGLVEALPNVLRHDVPSVQFRDKYNRVVPPVAKISYPQFLGFLKFIAWSEGSIEEPTYEKLQPYMLMDKSLPCGCYFYFYYYIYTDAASFGGQNVLISPLRHGVRKHLQPPEGEAPRCYWGDDICGSCGRGDKQPASESNAVRDVQCCLLETLWIDFCAARPGLEDPESPNLMAEVWEFCAFPLASSLDALEVERPVWI
ncbi:hypothetical protein EXIGLDRAFT_721569 [Exidia glandulosa HHB12029]|uniref:Fungal N-terminal domain-containing protein n=1 Tax=Exidia glandulosa HHB12029 TaxID=1314781 RepID=A0A166A7H0_EXIGL|nr:hypothetical protein EXIGLDRAFT_721569 [Exidia glandulosa HHB12029]